jgi:hypothetical protein
MGSTISVRAFARCGSVIAVDYFQLGSGLSIRAFVRVGSTLSVVGDIRHDGTHLATTGILSVGNRIGLGGSLSVF